MRQEGSWCVLGFAFGYREGDGGHEPGQSNDDLARAIYRHYRSRPKILQDELADAYAKLTGGRPRMQRIDRHRVRGAYLDTREVALQGRHLMSRHAYSRAVLVAHPDHLPRVRATCARLGIETVTTQQGFRARFDPHSAQAWTRNRRSWLKRECQAVRYYRRRGWI